MLIKNVHVHHLLGGQDCFLGGNLNALGRLEGNIMGLEGWSQTREEDGYP